MIVNAPTVESFDALKKSEVDGMIMQINHAFSQGVPPQEAVSFPAYVLAQLLKTVVELESRIPKPSEDAMSELLSTVSESNEKTTEQIAE